MDLASVIVAAAIGIGSGLATLYLGQKAGLGPVQEKLVSGLKDRVALLETENAALKVKVTEQDATIKHLKIDNEQLADRVAHLERLVLDKATA